MEFTLSDEQNELRSAVRGLLEKASTESDVRATAAAAHGYDEDLWGRLTQELGIAGLIVPEEYGGLGATFADLAVVVEEMGRALYVGPFVASALEAATMLVVAASDEAKSEHLESLAAGELIWTVALAEAKTESWDPAAVTTEATRRDGSWYLTGRKSLVLEAADADMILVVARTGAGLALFSVPAIDVADATTTRPSLDITRRTAQIELDDTPAQPVSDPAVDATSGVTAALARIGAVLAAEQLGGAQACLEESVGYAKVREQFGVPIGSFQAVKHFCADMLISVESARSLVYHALWMADSGDEEFEAMSNAAALFATEAANSVAALNVQIHGGIGFTWEHSAHLYYKRAFGNAVMVIDTPYRRKRLNATARQPHAHA